MDLTRGEKADLKQALDLLVQSKAHAVDVILYLYLKFDCKNADVQEAFTAWKKKSKEPRSRIITPN
jgi:hypothetical protein